MLACSLGQCMAGLCRSFGAYIACQGLVFGIGMHTKKSTIAKQKLT